MSGFFTIGETKDRPGIYKRIENNGSFDTAGARAGIGAAVVSGDWGPLNMANVITATEDLTDYVGGETGSGYKAIKEMFKGGVETIVVVRAGSGGTKASLTLGDTASTAVDVVTLTAKYPGTMPLSVSIQTSLTDASFKEVTIYTGTRTLEKFQITAGSAEVDGIVAALAGSAYVDAAKIAAGTGTLKTITQTSLTGGVQPTVNNTAYGTAMDAANSELFDVIAVDTNDTDVHATLAAFVARIYLGGDYPIGVISEPHSVTIANRKTHATAFNDEKIVYVYNGWKDASGNSYEGYMAAARIAGMIAASASNESLTHRSVSGAVSLIDTLTNTDIIAAIKAGCLVISRSKTGLIMIEKAINTLVSATGDKDAGWKKIRRVKTRFELMNRIEINVEPLVGAVNNDPDGRAAIIAAGQTVLDAMVAEGKILAGATFALDENYQPTGDSAWFIIQADDIDSFEIGYLTFRFRFAPENEE